MILYSTNCPRCRVLEAKLNKKGVDYNITNDVNVIIEKGFKTAPVLEIDGEFYTFEQALEKIKEI